MEGGEGASMLRSGGRHSRQRTVRAKVLWWPGPAGLMVLCDLCGHTGPQAQKRPVLFKKRPHIFVLQWPPQIR